MGGLTRAVPISERTRQWIALCLGFLMVVSGAAMRAQAASAGPAVSVVVQKLSALDHAPEEAVRRLGGAVPGAYP